MLFTFYKPIFHPAALKIVRITEESNINWYHLHEDAMQNRHLKISVDHDSFPVAANLSEV